MYIFVAIIFYFFFCNAFPLLLCAFCQLKSCKYFIRMQNIFLVLSGLLLNSIYILFCLTMMKSLLIAKLGNAKRIFHVTNWQNRQQASKCIKNNKIILTRPDAMNSAAKTCTIYHIHAHEDVYIYNY